MSIIAGIDTATGAPCLIGETPTCRLPNPGAANLAPVQVSIGAAPTQIVAARAARITVTVINTSATAFYIGASSSVSPSTGILIPAGVGVSITLPYAGPLYAVTASGTATVSAYELY